MVSSLFFPSSISWLELNTVRNPEPGTVVHAHRNPQNPLVLAQSKQELMPRQSGRNSPGLFLSLPSSFSPTPTSRQPVMEEAAVAAKAAALGSERSQKWGEKDPSSLFS